jgi:predicted ATPase
MPNGPSQTTRRDIAGVIANTTELMKLSEEYGLPQPRAMGLVYRGWALTSSGKATEGLALAEEGIAFLEQSGVRIFQSRTYCAIAEAYFTAGRYVEGLKHVEKALHVASEIGEMCYLPRMLHIRGKLLQASSQNDDLTETSLRQSLELARAQGAKSFELRAAIELVRLGRSQGRRDDARELLAPICNGFAEGFDTPDFKEAKDLVEARS